MKVGFISAKAVAIYTLIDRVYINTKKAVIKSTKLNVKYAHPLIIDLHEMIAICDIAAPKDT